ncbi:formylglycine-generating enzyme family protein [Pseudomonas folii]|jgi:sulfatase modifying factor 1|uniref:SUMF1/EgtB/PvdO family nonheme iron enzyme n=1 Tax=Pseudomonas folii TaxID=2762593 RepID=A0ABR7AUS1_9PSED|nr:SUMF1/EgtB/PvdO family nonheme iron enzyme [Pseudomonas folii]MBC3948672.1 SUMF1/EgtB/PvdO family nonheme iron enzyme [Pseudomonas folii]
MNRFIVTVVIFTTLALKGCEEVVIPSAPLPVAVTDMELQQFVASIKSNLIFVEGGEFLMGDFGFQYGSEGKYYDADTDSKPLHKVELSSFSIGKFKVTNAEYQYYLKSNGLVLRDRGTINKKKWDDINSLPYTPAHVDWYEAERYCGWLASVTKLDVRMPTEAQWEYAARSRGQFLAVATDDGTYRAEPRSLISESYDPKGINISSRGNRVTFAKEMGWTTESYTPLPVDMFPPNPLGLYSMSDNGFEWVSDWYDPDYYKNSPLKDPQGPDKPVFKDHLGHFTKVLRGQDVADPYWGVGINVHRKAQAPLGRFSSNDLFLVADKTMRCVVNSSAPVTTP